MISQNLLVATCDNLSGVFYAWSPLRCLYVILWYRLWLKHQTSLSHTRVQCQPILQLHSGITYTHAYIHTHMYTHTLTHTYERAHTHTHTHSNIHLVYDNFKPMKKCVPFIFKSKSIVQVQVQVKSRVITWQVASQ